MVEVMCTGLSILSLRHIGVSLLIVTFQVFSIVFPVHITFRVRLLFCVLGRQGKDKLKIL